MNNVNNWKLTPVSEIKWVVGLIFKRPMDKQVFKVVGIPPDGNSILWDYAETPTGKAKEAIIRLLSSTEYFVGTQQTKEESVIQKIKELNLRYANRGASIRLGNNG